MSISKEAVKEALGNVIEPDLKKDIVELDLVKNIEVDGTTIRLVVQVSNPAMHSRKRMEEACEFAIHRVLGNEWTVETDVKAMDKEGNSADTRKVLPGVKNIIAVASGKGGVGKSTVAANLAAGLAKRGHSVGLIDADIYGPSMPMMFDLVYEKPKTVEEKGKQYIQPLENYGVKMLSIGFFADPTEAIVWRGPMASKALNQMFTDALWGPLDYMIVDLPPGTGDIHLSLVQVVPLTAAVIVSTPQEVALSDAKKGVNMFRLDSINVPVVGMVENMAFFMNPDGSGEKHYLFGREGVRNLAEDMNVPFLGELPIIQSIREAGDVGRPAVLQDDTPASEVFNEIIDKFVKEVEKRNETQDPTKSVKVSMQYPK